MSEAMGALRSSLCRSAAMLMWVRPRQMCTRSRSSSLIRLRGNDLTMCLPGRRFLMILFGFATATSGACPYYFGPGPRSFNPESIKSDYGSFVLRIFAGKEQGTGFVLDPQSGYVLTAYHVVKDAQGENIPIKADTERRPGVFFRLVLVKSLCKVWSGTQERCADDAGNAGVDVALLKMVPDDLSRYVAYLGVTSAPDIALGWTPPAEAFKAGYPNQTTSSDAARLLSTVV